MTAVLTWAAWIAGVIAAAAALGGAFRALVSRIVRGPVARSLRTMPLSAAFGMAVIAIYVIVALFAPWIAPFGERDVVGPQYAPWDGTYWLGTDNLGRDMFSRLIYGARNTVGIALATTAIAFGVGAALGLTAAALGGWVDMILSRIVDLVMAIPALILSLLLLTLRSEEHTSELQS